MCPETEGWPHVCPEGCPRRPRCSYPKCSYSAAEAHASYLERLSSSRSGADLTDEQLAGLDAAVSPLVRAGHSFGSIAASHPELGVCARTLYNYQAAGLLSTTALDLPRKARVRPRKKAKAPSGRERVDRSGRRYEDFLALPDAERALVCEADSVEGRAGGSRDLLSLMPVARRFQLYLLKGHGDPAATVPALDRLERVVGSREGFALAFGLILADRGVEFDDWAGMERSCLEEGGRRCRVFYCDARATNQKSRCERNHEQLRRVLPKGASDFDALTDADVGLACSHVNSYPLESMGGLCGFDLLGPLVPWASLAELGIARVPCDEVVLRPSLIPHAHVPRSAG